MAVILIGANDVTHTVLPSDLGALPLRGGTPPARGRRRGAWSAPAPTWAPSGRSRRRCARWPGPGRAGWPPRRRSPSSRRAAARSRSARSSGPEFAAAPALLFGPDQFHPSAAGYARAGRGAGALDAGRARAGREDEEQPRGVRGEGVLPIATAAVQASQNPGTELDGTEVGGAAPRRRRPLGRAGRRRRPPADRGRDPSRRVRRGRGRARHDERPGR